ncbi:MAG: hypothetical protein ACOZIN_13090 [Myxococcota bacterium]
MKVTVRLQNKGDREIGLEVEPWGEYYRIAPGAQVDLVIAGPIVGEPNADPQSNGVIDLQYETDLITVYGWRSAEIEVVGATMAPWPTGTGEKK